ncbi:MAG: glycosyl transferase [Bacteroidetes bacterium]|nr:glycosyl transferase [Bacteroidota bacterium]
MALHILIIRFSSIGDIVLSSPVMRCLKNAYPDCHISYVTKKGYAKLLEANPYVDRILSLDDNWTSLKQELKNNSFDYIFDLHHNLRSKRLVRGLSGEYYAFRKLNPEKWLLVNFKINRLPKIHIVDRYLATTKCLAIEYDGLGLDFFIPETTTLPALPDRPFVAVAIGGQHRTKRMPLIKLIELIEHINSPLVLLGGKEDKEVADELCQKLPDQSILNYCGAISLNQSALILTKAKGLATHDTGMMHIAAALDVPIISIWGNTVPEFGMYPFYPKSSAGARNAKIFEVNGLKCRPCSKIGYDSCPKGHFNCMNLQQTELIAQALNRLPSVQEK